MSQTDLVERVAKAMFEKDQEAQETHGTNYLIFGRNGPVDWDFVTSAEVAPVFAERYRTRAMAAILAVRVAILDSDDILKACKPGFIIFLDRAFRQ